MSAGSIVVLTLALAGAVATSRRWLASTVYAGLLATFLMWWSTIVPSNDRIWTADVARTVTGTIDGDRLIVTNVRDFNWHANGDFDPAWEHRSYSLSWIANIDLIMSVLGRRGNCPHNGQLRLR